MVFSLTIRGFDLVGLEGFTILAGSLDGQFIFDVHVVRAGLLAPGKDLSKYGSQRLCLICAKK